MTEFNERLEGEIKSHEKEMLHKIVIKKYGDKSLEERIRYVKETYKKDSWTADEMMAKLAELGLLGKESREEIAKTI